MTNSKKQRKSRKYNKNFTFLINSFKNKYRGAVLEGSSRSGKTFSSIDFMFYLCSLHDESITINIIKETYNSFKTTLYDDLSRRLNDYGLDNPFEHSKEVSSFKIFNHKINLLGADKPSKFHGASCDYAWFNESLDVSNAIFDQVEMRCRIFWWMDYNPKVSLHYVYDKVIPRDDVNYLHSTFIDNIYISKAELNKILSYEPTHPEDRHLDIEKRRKHPTNIKQGTADDYMWAVYGMGKRMSHTGLIFKNIKWINEFPKEIHDIGFGLDFGYTNHESALVKAGVGGNNLYLELLLYEPTENADVLGPLIKAINKDNIPIWADSADPIMINDLNKLGLKVFAISKPKGSIKYGIGLMKSYNIHVVKNRNAQKEQENYRWKEINGIPLDEPVKQYDHFFDAARYITLAKFRKSNI